MTDQTATPPAGAPAPAADATLTLTRTDLEALIDARVEARTEAYRKKVNGELAGFRKRFLGAETPETQEAPQPAPSVDAKALLGLGARLAKLDDTQRSSLLDRFGATPDVLAGVLDALEMSAPTPSSATGTGRPQPQPTTRGAPPAPAGSGLPLPRTRAEWMEQRKDPKRAAQLDADPEFDPASLPIRLR